VKELLTVLGTGVVTLLIIVPTSINDTDFMTGDLMAARIE
jgi:hypothetical protein